MTAHGCAVLAAMAVAVAGVDYLLPWLGSVGFRTSYVLLVRADSGEMAWRVSFIGLLWRTAAYAVLSLGAVLLARATGWQPPRRRTIAWVVVATALSLAYWCVVDPIALPVLLPPNMAVPVSAALRAYAPSLADIYDTWGFPRLFWWLVAGHYGMLLLIAWATLVVRAQGRRSA